ncbi:hypothetical protein [Pelagibius sp. 7325]|uniref:hypothetical protein n=1 Tax=Pelagibius sp. 7325 TaxID=3131994 RepID=UPI0030EF15C6
MLPPRNSLWQQPGSTLWSLALTFWLAAGGPAEAEDLSWALDVARGHIATEYAWPESDYHLRIAREDPDRVAVYAHHMDDNAMGKLTSEGTIMAGGGKSFEMVISRKTHGVILEWYFQ